MKRNDELAATSFGVAIAEAVRQIRKAVAAHRSRIEMAHIAKVFNDRYTYRCFYVEGMAALPGTAMGGLTPRGGNAWMCPECNRIHHPESCSVFSGLQYLRCCSTPEGNRLGRGIRVEP